MKLFAVILTFFCATALWANPDHDSIAIEIGYQIENDFSDGSNDVLINIFNEEAFLSYFIIEQENNIELEELNQGIREGNFIQQFSNSILNELESGGYYNFINYYSDSYGNYYLRFRLFGDHGLNYHEYYVQFDDENEYQISDIYVYSIGEYFSETMNYIYSSLAQEVSDNPEPLPMAVSSEEILALNRIKINIENGNMEEAQNIFDYELAPRTKNHKLALLYQLRMTSHENLDKYQSVVNKLLEVSISPATTHLLGIDYYFLSKNYELAMRSIDSLYELTSDDFLDFYRGNISFAQQDFDRSENYMQNFARNYAYTTEAYDNLLALYVHLNKLDSAVSIIHRMNDHLYLDISVLHRSIAQSYPDLANYDSYKDWLSTNNFNPDEIQNIIPEIHLTEFQKELNESFRNPEKTPLQEEDFKTFESLVFFSYDSTFVLSGELVLTQAAPPIQLKTSTANFVEYKKYGEIHFILDQQLFTLSIFEGMSESVTKEDKLFIPFTDLTTNNETYGGGRYLEIDYPTNSKVILDFNSAYNPYCAYNSAYSCPIPPKENHLNVEIKAGVMDFVKK